MALSLEGKEVEGMALNGSSIFDNMSDKSWFLMAGGDNGGVAPYYSDSFALYHLDGDTLYIKGGYMANHTPASASPTDTGYLGVLPVTLRNNTWVLKRSRSFGSNGGYANFSFASNGQLKMDYHSNGNYVTSFFATFEQSYIRQ